MHDEAAPGTGIRVIPGRGATRPIRLRWLRRRVRPLPSGGGALLPPLTYFPTKSNPPTARGNGDPPATETGQAETEAETETERDRQ